jgi:hypothetical protein
MPFKIHRPMTMGADLIEGDTVPIMPSQFAEMAIKVVDQYKNEPVPFDFTERPYLNRIYNTPQRRILTVFGRQTEKSTTLSNIALALCCLNVGYTVLYVSPSGAQTKEFSETRITETIGISQTLQAYTNKKLLDSVFKKQWLNQAKLILRYCFLHADRVRGISTPCVLVDELQDILPDLLPVILETTSRWPGVNVKRMAGTPKSMDNVIQYYWEDLSNQCEWVIPCEASGGDYRHWNIVGIRNIGKSGLICATCGAPLDPRVPDAQWAAMAVPKTSDPENAYEGFRISQLTVPWILQTPEGWAEIIHKRETYTPAQFHNEVLARSFDSGVRPITKDELVRCCDKTGKIDMGRDSLLLIKKATQGRPVWLGVDWSGGSEASRTVVHALTYIENRLQVFWSHRFEGDLADPANQLAEMEAIIHEFEPLRIGCDFGGGFWPNTMLQRRYGIDRIQLFQYTNNGAQKFSYNNNLRRWMVLRNLVMADIFTAMKDGRIGLPHWDSWARPFGSDCLAVYAEYNERTHQDVYSKKKGETDDSYHALIYGILVSCMTEPRPDIFAPVNYDMRHMAVVRLEEEVDKQLTKEGTDV